MQGALNLIGIFELRHLEFFGHYYIVEKLQTIRLFLYLTLFKIYGKIFEESYWYNGMDIISQK